MLKKLLSPSKNKIKSASTSDLRITSGQTNELRKGELLKSNSVINHNSEVFNQPTFFNHELLGLDNNEVVKYNEYKKSIQNIGVKIGKMVGSSSSSNHDNSIQTGIK